MPFATRRISLERVFIEHFSLFLSPFEHSYDKLLRSLMPLVFEILQMYIICFGID
jgi:hypothetical protein